MTAATPCSAEPTDAARVPISVVVATNRPWPEVEITLESLRRQLDALGAELIVLDADGSGLPGDFSTRFPRARVVCRPGASVFQLRLLGAEMSRGELIALTEDHCRLPPDWLEKLIDTHRQYPEAAAVGGAVENGPTRGLIDWANYFVAHVPLMPPIASGRADMISMQAGVALKRHALPREPMPLGLMEILYIPELRRRGAVLIANGAIVVEHAQSHGFWNTFAIHFHNGRSIAGFFRQQSSRGQLARRLITRPALPALLTLRAAVAVIRKRRRAGTFLKALPLVMAVSCCHTAGEIVGCCFGPGRSPHHIP